MRYLTMALSKGRLADLSIDLLERAGVDCSELKQESRKLIFTDEKNRINLPRKDFLCIIDLAILSFDS